MNVYSRTPGSDVTQSLRFRRIIKVSVFRVTYSFLDHFGPEDEESEFLGNASNSQRHVIISKMLI